MAERSKAHGSGLPDPQRSSIDFRVSKGAWVRIPLLSFSFCLHLITFNEMLSRSSVETVMRTFFLLRLDALLEFISQILWITMGWFDACYWGYMKIDYLLLMEWLYASLANASTICSTFMSILSLDIHSLYYCRLGWDNSAALLKTKESTAFGEMVWRLPGSGKGRQNQPFKILTRVNPPFKFASTQFFIVNAQVVPELIYSFRFVLFAFQRLTAQRLG